MALKDKRCIDPALDKNINLKNMKLNMEIEMADILKAMKKNEFKKIAHQSTAKTSVENYLAAYLLFLYQDYENNRTEIELGERLRNAFYNIYEIASDYMNIDEEEIPDPNKIKEFEKALEEFKN